MPRFDTYSRKELLDYIKTMDGFTIDKLAFSEHSAFRPYLKDSDVEDYSDVYDYSVVLDFDRLSSSATDEELRWMAVEYESGY